MTVFRKPSNHRRQGQEDPAETGADTATAAKTQTRFTRPSLQHGWYRLAAAIIVLLAVGLGAVTSRHLWLPRVVSWRANAFGAAQSDAALPADDAAANGQMAKALHADSHPGHDDATALALSAEGRKNVGLELIKIELRDFDRTVTMPAIIVERAGRSEITVSATMTGIITRIYPIRGEAVVSGQRLFDLRLTHEDVVEKQSQLLQDLQQLDVVNREVVRLEEVTRTGAVAGKTLLRESLRTTETGSRHQRRTASLATPRSHG